MIFVDRTSYKNYFECPMKRFLSRHIYGVGINVESVAIPLATGSHAHSAVEHILKVALDTKNIPKSADVRDAIDKVTEAYNAEIEHGGFYNVIDTSRADHIVQEQITLISGLVWSWASFILPEFLEDFEILNVEQEMERIISCDCGLAGLGTVAQHKAKGCNGLCIMTRPDVVVKKYSTNTIAYIELKTGSKIDSGTFDGDVQFAFGAAGIEGFTGETLAESYVHGLIKGYRKNQYNPATKSYDLPEAQMSSLCYAYVDPGISGLVPQDIKFKYGKGVTKSYKKTPVWEIVFEDRPPEVPPLEHYISLMSDDELSSHVRVFGPFPYPKLQVEETLKDIEHLERRIQPEFTYVNELIDEKGFADNSTQEAVHQYIPKSWDCRKYGKNVCQYYPICMKQNGWEDPRRYLNYVDRTPNHPVEFEV